MNKASRQRRQSTDGGEGITRKRSTSHAVDKQTHGCWQPSGMHTYEYITRARLCEYDEWIPNILLNRLLYLIFIFIFLPVQHHVNAAKLLRGVACVCVCVQSASLFWFLFTFSHSKSTSPHPNWVAFVLLQPLCPKMSTLPTKRVRARARVHNLWNANFVSRQKRRTPTHRINEVVVAMWIGLSWAQFN